MIRWIERVVLGESNEERGWREFCRLLSIWEESWVPMSDDRELKRGSDGSQREGG